MRRYTKFTNKRRKRFLKELAETGNVTHSAKVVGVGRRTVYDLTARDKEFAQQFEDSVEAGTDRLVEEAQRRARDGFEEPVFFQGKQVGVIRKWSDNLLMFLIKARRPEYRDRVDQTHLHIVARADALIEALRNARKRVGRPEPDLLPPGGSS